MQPAAAGLPHKMHIHTRSNTNPLQCQSELRGHSRSCAPAVGTGLISNAHFLPWATPSCSSLRSVAVPKIKDPNVVFMVDDAFGLAELHQKTNKKQNKNPKGKEGT